MDHRGLDDTWDLDQVALQEAPGSPAAVSSSGAAEPGNTVSHGKVLARLPDLDPLRSGGGSDAKAVGSDGRILSRGLSTKLLVGGGVLLVGVAALFPFVFGGSNEPKPGTPPAPNAEEAPIWKAESAKKSETLPAAANVLSGPNMSFNPDLPPAPDFIGTAQAPGPDPAPQIPPVNDQGRSDVTGQKARTPAVDRQSWSDGRRPQARANQMMTIGNLTPTPAGVYADEYRRETQADARANVSSGNPVGLFTQQEFEPGVARLEGIIEKPSVRTSYDAARSSVH